MDIIGHCLSLAPVPYLSLSWSIFQFIWTTIQEVQSSKEQLRALATSIAQLLQTLDAEMRAGRLIPKKTSAELDNLAKILDEISTFVKVQSSYSFLKVLYKKDDRVTSIEQYHRQITATVTAFQISNVRDWQSRHDVAKAADQQTLIEYLSRLEKNQKELAKALDAQQGNMASMMASLQKSILQQIEFEVPLNDERPPNLVGELDDNLVRGRLWTGDWIGRGQVYKGTWNKTDVALKVLRTDAGVMPSSAAIRREVKTWSRLHHPHILQFLGANIWDDRPFILMPYLKNGNARDYIHEHLECDRLQILHHVSLGLVYLHSNSIIHGDLKALNVLIDDGGRAILCDFGLSRMKADATSRSAVSGQGIVTGSRNWMAPERFKGGAPRKPSDIYAFGMTIYEIMTLEIPLGHINYDEFARLVADEDVRPERPYDDEAPDMFDGLWDLALQCWVKDPLSRPSASAVSDDIKGFLLTVTPPAGSKVPAMISPPAASATTYPISEYPERRSRSPSLPRRRSRSRSPPRDRRYRSRSPPPPIYISSPPKSGYPSRAQAPKPVITSPSRSHSPSRRSRSRSPRYSYPSAYTSGPPQIIQQPPFGYGEDNVFFEFDTNTPTPDAGFFGIPHTNTVTTVRVVIKLWDDRVPRTASTFRQNASHGRMGLYSFAKYSFQKDPQRLSAETYDSKLFAAFDAELDPNFAQGGFGPSIVAISCPLNKWKPTWGGEKPPKMLALCLTGIPRGDKKRKWLPFGEIISGLEDLRALANGFGVHITNCGTVAQYDLSSPSPGVVKGRRVDFQATPIPIDFVTDDAVAEAVPGASDPRLDEHSDGECSNGGPSADNPSEGSDSEDDPTGVMSAEFQDESLCAIYKGLPALAGFCDVRAFGRNNAEMEFPRVSFSALRGVLADSSLNSLMKGLIFDRSGFFVNTSRVSPEILRVDSHMIKMADSNCFAVGVMLGVITECFLISECSLGQRSTVHKVSIAPFAQEMRRDTSLWGQLLDFESISGPVSEAGLSFSTRSQKTGSPAMSSSPSTSKRGRNSLFTTVKSPMRSVQESVAAGYQSARQFTETVPIYDGRPTDFCPDGFTFTDKNFLDLTKFLIFADGKRDLPADSVVAVGYTLGTYMSDGYPSPNLSPNVQFVILLGAGATEAEL